MSTALRYAARSDRGLVRQNNEDSAYAGPRLLALADGMGGHAAGEVASHFVIASLARLDEDQPPSDLTGALTKAMREGNENIAAHAKAHPETDGMGCTLTALLFDGRRVGLLHVGDSRAYLMREGTLTQITRDDTFVQSLVDEGTLTADEAHSHPQRSLILKALTGEPVEPTTVIREVRTGDRYLLCSDGLSDPVSFETITETLATGTADAAADRLVSLALRSGGPDNITVVVADVVDDSTHHPVDPVVVGTASADDPVDSEAIANTAAGRAAAFSRNQAASRTATEGSPTAGQGSEPNATEGDEPGDPPPPRGSRWKFLASVVGVLLLLAGIAVVSALLIRSNYFVAEKNSQVVVKRGIPGEIFGLSLSSVNQVACLNASGTLTLHDPRAIPAGCNVFALGDLQEPARETVRAGLPSGNLSDAQAQISRLAQDNLLPVCKPETGPPSATTPSREPTPGTDCRAVN